MNGGGTRSLVIAAVLFVALVAVGAAATAAVPTDSSVATADDVVGPDANASETTIDAAFVGTVADEQTVTVEASGVTDNGTTVDGVDLTVTIGGEPATTATVTSGELTAEVDPSVLDLEPTDSAEVGLQGYNVTDPATVEVVHEAFELNSGFDLRSVPQGAELTAENATAVNVWNATTGTYDAVTDPVFETDRDVHRGLYLASNGDARLGYTFETGTTDRGTVELANGWNYVSSNFNISSTRNLTVAEDLDLVAGDAQDLDIFTADFSQPLAPNDTVEAYDGYWVFVDEGDQQVVRNLTGPAYDRGAREDVLQTAEGNVSFTDQATASSTFTGASLSTPGVVVGAEANVESAVVVTYQNGSDLVIAGLDTFSESELDGSGVTVPVTEFGGFPGEHTAHIIPTAELSGSYDPGDTVSIETADAILDSEAATVFQGIVDFANQSFEDATTEVTAATAGLVGDPDTLFAINLHESTAEGPGEFVGASPVINGSNEDVPIVLQDTAGNPLEFNTTDEYIAMIHVVDDESVSEGDLLPPATFPVLPHASASGSVPGGVTDGGEAAAFSAEGAELSFDGQAVGVDEQGNAVVYVDNITEAEQVEQTDVSNPAEDLVVLYEGETLTQDSLVDFRNVGDAQDGELVLQADNATPGQHTVELYADARFSIDPTAQDIDVDHPLIEETAAGSDESADGSDGYLVVLEEDLQAPTGVDRASTAESLQQQAELAQAPVVESLEQLDGATVEQQYWITNALLVSTDGVSQAALERIDGVESVVENVEAEHPSPAPTTGGAGEVRSTANHSVTYGLEAIDVPGFEETYDTQGEGTRVAIIDDGLNVSHPDIDLEEGVQVADGQIINEPPTITPGSQHGAHVAGTAVGTADPAGDVPRYSVAPGADLLKADIWVGGPTLGDTITAVQWSVSESADVTSMSLGFGQGLGESTVVPAMADTIQNAEAAGTLVIGSAGNEGSGAAGGPVTSPGAEFNGLSVGASAEGGAIAGFSSGTTVTPNDVLLFPAGASYPDYFPREYVKPDVAAPGVGVLSTGPLGTLVAEDPAYSLSSGTSMAAPHAAGAAALVQAATTEQLGPTTIESALAESAEKPTTEFGGQNERDIRYGTGIINVTAATMAAQNTTTISGTITDSATDDALAGVQVTTDTGVTTATDANGTYSLTVTNDTDSTVVTVEAFGYTDETETVSLGSDQTVDFALDPEVAVTPVAGQPAFAEFTDSFTIAVDVQNLEEYAVELADAQGVTPADVDVTVAGTTISPGENISFAQPVSANGVPVVVEVNGTFSEGDQFALAHTFSGPGTDVEVTTGPTTLTETQAPAEFELSGFSAPTGQEVGQAEPYAAAVTVTNAGQTPGEAEIRWFLGPLGLAGDNPVEQLAPGESTEVVLDFGEIDIGASFGGVPVNLLQGFDAVPTAPAASGDSTFAEFSVGDGLFPLLDPIDPDQPRGAAETSTVYDTSVSIDDQTDEDSTSEVVVSSSNVTPEDPYVVVLHEETNGAPGQIIGNSGNLTGPQENVTISLDQALNTTTDVVAMLHFASGSGPYGAPISAFDPAADGLVPVTDTATVEIQQAEGGNVEFQSQVLGTSDGSPAVLAENVTAVDVATVDNAFDPQDDFLVLTEGTGVTGSDDVLDFVQLSELNESADVALNATGATPGQHTVVLHEPNDAGTGPDPDAPRTDASTGEVINATATVFDGSVNITDQQFEGSTSEITVDTSNLQPANASEYKIVVHNQTGVPAGGVGSPIGFSDNLTGAETDVTIPLTETLNTATDVLTMLHFPGNPTGPPIPTLNGTAFGIGDDQAGTVTDTATVEIQQAEGGNVEFQSQVLGTNNGSAAVLAENVTAVDVVTVNDAFNPQEDFLVLTNGTSVTGPDNVIDAVQLSEFGDGSDVALNATGATPGQHTVVLHEPNDAGTGPDPDAPRTDASTGEVVNASATVFTGSVNITDQQFEDNTSQVIIDASDLQPETASEYKIVVHNQTGVAPGGVGPPIGFSANLTGAQTNVTVPLTKTLNTTTDVLTMLHFPGDPTGPPIPTLNGTDFSIGDAQAGTVTDTATVEIQQAQGGNVEFQSQVLGTNSGSAAVLAENVQSVDVVTVDSAFDPQDDFLVLTNGTSVTGPDNVIDAVQLSEFNESADVTLNATGATPGQHTVVLHEPNDAGTGPDPDAPRTDASTGEVVNATATVFDGSVSITDQQFETNTSQVTVDASDLQPAGASEYKIVVHNQTGVAPGGVGPPIGFSDNLTGAETDVTIPLTETLNTTTDVLTMLHFPGNPTGPPIPILNGTAFGIGDDQAGTVTDTATVDVQRFRVSDLTPTDATVEENEPFDVSATVENIGVFDDSPTVELRLEPNGTEIRNQTLTLAGGSSKKVTFENVTVNEPGEYNHTVAVGGDRVSGDLNVTDLPPGNFSVDFVDQTNETIAGEQQSFDVAVENVGSERSVQAVELDWGNGSYNASEFVTLNPGESTVATLTVQTDDDEFLGQYNVTASSRNDTDTTGARINPERIIEADQAAAGATVNVTVTGRLAAPQSASLVEKYDPAVNDSSARQPARTYNGTAFGPEPIDQQFNGNRSLLVASAENIQEAGPGTLELRYQIELPSDATTGDEFGYDEAKSFLELEGVAFDIGGDDTVTVSSDGGT